MANTQRKCPYKNCKYGGVVDISTDEYMKVGSRYYHKECLLEKKASEAKKSCGYSHCKHGGVVDTQSDGYIEDNGKFYHMDCYSEKRAFSEIIDFWYREIDEDVVFNQLQRVLQELIYKRGLEAEYVLYAIKKKAQFLNYPSGIYYAVGDKRLKANWRIIREAERLKLVKEASKKSAKMEPMFKQKEEKKSNWTTDIFGGN